MRRAAVIGAIVAMGQALVVRPTVAQETQSTPPQQQAAATPAVDTQGQAIARFTQDGRITVTGKSSSIPTLLAEISFHLNIPIVVDDQLAYERVSMTFRETPVYEALGQLLAQYDTFYLYAAQTGGGKQTGTDQGPALATIWVYPKGQGRALMPVPLSKWASVAEFERQLDDPDVNVRAAAYEALIERQGPAGLPTLMRALADDRQEVRLSALHMALDVEVEVAPMQLASVALSDPSHLLRLVALQALEGRPEARQVAESLKTDANELVRMEARRILGLSDKPASGRQEAPQRNAPR